MNLVLSLHVLSLLPSLVLVPLALPCLKLVLARFPSFPLPMTISNAEEFQQDILGLELGLERCRNMSSS